MVSDLRSNQHSHGVPSPVLNWNRGKSYFDQFIFSAQKGFPNLCFQLGDQEWISCPLMNMTSLHITSWNPCPGRNRKWAAAVQLLYGREQIFNPFLSSSQGNACSVTRKYSWLQRWVRPRFLWVTFVSSLQYNYFFQLSYLIICQRHFPWVKKSDFQSWILIYLIFIYIMTFIICYFFWVAKSHVVFIFQNFREGTCFDGRDQPICLFLDWLYSTSSILLWTWQLMLLHFVLAWPTFIVV